MESVTVDGTIYTKASTIARKFRYTSDYIGQLCRSNKADCQLVGRSWYVSEASLINHKDARYKEKSVRGNEITIKMNVESSSSQQSVYPRLKRTTAKQVLTQHIPVHHALASSVKYYNDDAEPLPNLSVKVVESEPVKIAEVVIPEDIKEETIEKPKVLKVKTEDKPQFNLNFTPLPRVLLQGIVPVTAIDDAGVKFTSEELITPVDLAALVSPTPVVVKETLIHHTPQTALRPSPVIISVPPKTVRLWPLLLVALISGGCLCGFILSSSQRMYIVDNQVTASIFFALTDVYELLVD